MSALKPFRIAVPQSRLDDLYERLRRTLWPSEPRDAGWDYGPPLRYLLDLVEYLLTEYDWHTHESRINAYPQFMTEIDGQRLHLLHARAATRDAIPLLLIHGWPGSFIEFTSVIDDFVSPERGRQAFHVVVPSLPGFAFSGPTRERGWHTARIAATLLKLMHALGYERFGVQGNDAGALIGPELGRLAPHEVLGVHVSAAGAGLLPSHGYEIIQSTRPQALAYALSDSPVGLLAWVSEVFTSFGAAPEAVDRDMLLTNFLIYWFTGTAASSMRLFYENAHDPAGAQPRPGSGVPTAVARNGHYAVLQSPGLLAEDIREFFHSARRTAPHRAA